ncbi:MAG: undecaprenyl-diphosphate phosphatase [Candidatus Omnitrophica bacterium]|nr:undecaprenyl-diphosphate phosphatase [Candidatus Omnitrophota bacterium]
MLVIKYIFLGLIQGLTEFLPVSSSAHLVIFQELLDIQDNQLILDIVLHLGTLLAIIVFLYRDIKSFLNKKIIFLVLLATFSTALVAILGKGFFESLFLSAKYVSLPLAITGIVLIFTKRHALDGRKLTHLKPADAVCFGLVQGICVIPGLSRSGLTISTLLLRNVERETAFKFSFLASILAVLGALFLELGCFSNLALCELKYMSFAFFTSFLSGLLALKILLLAIRKAKLHFFGYYCLILALALSFLIL